MIYQDPKINRDAVLLLLTSTLFAVAIALSNTFVNVYLWKVAKDYILIGWFNLYQYIAMLITFIIVGKMTKFIDRIILLRLGVGILAIFYFIVLILGSASTKYYALLGLTLGTGQGFYWFSYNVLYFEITGPQNRDLFNGWNGLLTSIAGIIAPFLSGLFLSRQTGLTGYTIIFFISLVIFAIAVFISFLFYKRKNKGKYQLITVLKQSISHSDWRNITLGMFAQGSREGIIIFLIGLLIYIETGSEFSLGTYTMLISAVALITYFLVGKLIKKEWRNISMIIGSIMMAIAVLPIFFKIEYKTLLIYGIGTSLFAPLYFIPLTSKVFDEIGENETSASLRGEYIILREIGLNSGRILITIIFIFFIKKVGTEHLRYLLLISGSMQILTSYFMKSVQFGNNVNSALKYRK